MKEGDSVWFWMKDTTENATLVIEVEKDGATKRSGDLVFECELDENGSKINEDCNTRYDFIFNPQNSAGVWNFTFLTYVNDTLVKTSYGSVIFKLICMMKCTTMKQESLKKPSLILNFQPNPLQELWP